jgi:hypothetical protein
VLDTDIWYAKKPPFLVEVIRSRQCGDEAVGLQSPCPLPADPYLLSSKDRMGILGDGGKALDEADPTARAERRAVQSKQFRLNR